MPSKPLASIRLCIAGWLAGTCVLLASCNGAGPTQPSAPEAPIGGSDVRGLGFFVSASPLITTTVASLAARHPTSPGIGSL